MIGISLEMIVRYLSTMRSLSSNLKFTTSMFTDCAVGEEFEEEGVVLLKK